MKRSLALFFTFCFISVFGINVPKNTDIIVAADGSGDYTTIQEAVNAAPDNNSSRTLIFIKNGFYEESVNVGSSKKNIVLYGEDILNVILSYKTEPTLDLATLEVYATDFIAYNMTIENTAGSTYGPAQALRQEADKSIYLNCRLIGNQDTYRTGKVRSYNRNCYYEGTVDFIFGDGSIVFEDCEIYSKGGTAITAASTRDYAEYGYVFRNCRVVSKKGTTTHLGRPWKDYAAVAFINCELPDEIIDAGWHNWNQPTREETSRFAEYRNYGPGADTSKRVDWADMLTSIEADQYNTLNVLKKTYSSSPVTDNWNPYNDIKNAVISGLNMEGDGYGMNEGGNGGTVVTVDNETDLKNYAKSDNKYIIKISGNIVLTNRIDVGSNTTITGISEESGISGNAINITNEKENIIVKYLNITNPDGDGITVWNGQNVFITHISFYDCGDGCCDINRGSDSVTVSWCKFYYTSQTDHRFTMIADGAMTWNDQGEVISYEHKLNLTLHHNWWYSRSDQRMPASTNAKIHLYNNYWNCITNSYCSNARHLSEFYSENNYYDNVNNPIYGENGGTVHTSGNVYNNCNGSVSPGTDDVFVPEYSYILTTVNSIPQIVTSRAGNVWGDPDQYSLSVSSDGNGLVTPLVSNKIYNMGQLVTLEAFPNTNYRFKSWTGDLSSSKNPFAFYMITDLEITASFESTVGINELNDFNNNIFPNPSLNGDFFIRFNSNENKNVVIRIYSMNGKLTFEKNYNTNEEMIRVNSNLDQGLYIIDATTEHETKTMILNVL